MPRSGANVTRAMLLRQESANRQTVAMNRLAQETSPYLLQHADNPVDWYPWGEEALARAREENRPILLSIGYAACHWCHVMEHESFEDAETAAAMNELFVNVKVDREERPDLDALYMDAVDGADRPGRLADDRLPDARRRAVLRRHVLPARAAARPAELPADPRRRSPRRIASAPRDVARTAEELVDAIRRGAEVRPSNEPLTESILGDAVRALSRLFDPAWGGFGGAPKFPPASALELLMRRDERRHGHAHARRDGRRGHVRPGRRRLPPLLGRRALARPALREDALRQRAPRPRVPARVAR